MLAHQGFKSGKILLLHQIHQTVMLLMSGGTAAFLPDRHGGEAADIFVLPSNDPQNPVLAGNGGQAGMEIPALGTTHADYFYGDIPCTRPLSAEEIDAGYELNTGNVIVETIGDSDPMAVPGIVVKNHGPFSWGKTAKGAVYNAVVLEKVAEMAYKTLTLNPRAGRVPQYLLDKHYLRKHGANAYYGQGTGEDH